MLDKLFFFCISKIIFVLSKQKNQLDWTKLYKMIKPLFPAYSDLYCSQEGEDILLKRILKKNGKGFYVDIGALDPFRFSTTFHFYLQGWKGINIDPLPGTETLFNKIRTRDVNLEIAISDSEKTLNYYRFTEPAFNTFTETRVSDVLLKSQIKLIETLQIKTYRLETILDKYLPPNTVIDFLNIDVEGHEMYVLESNNWNKYNPRIILVEHLDMEFEEIFTNPLYLYLKEKNYKLLAKTKFTLFFEHVENVNLV